MLIFGRSKEDVKWHIDMAFGSNGHLLPPSIEEYVAENHPVRAYDAFVEALDLRVLGIDLNPDQVGNAQL